MTKHSKARLVAEKTFAAPTSATSGLASYSLESGARRLYPMPKPMPKVRLKPKKKTVKVDLRQLLKGRHHSSMSRDAQVQRKCFIAMLDHEAPKLAKRIARFLEHERVRILDYLLKRFAKVNLADALKAKPKMDPIKPTAAEIEEALDALDLDGWTEVSSIMRDKILAAFETAGEDGIRMVVADATEAALNLVNEDAVSYASRRAADLVTEIAETTRSDLRELIASAVEDGASVGELSDGISDMFGFSSARADMIARTELAMAHTQGNITGWKLSGADVTHKQSVIGSEHDVDDECNEAEADGAIPMDESFSNGELSPPYHPNCVCVLVPVFVDEVDD